MNKYTIKIKDKFFPYILKKRKGMRCMQISINSMGKLVVSAPKWYPIYLINKFLEEKVDWLWEKLKNVDFSLIEIKEKENQENYKKNKEFARSLIRERIEFFNQHYKFSYQRISIKNQKTCWGSCSQRGNLNFNYCLINLSEKERDYIIVHELCHLRELNHGKEFWKLVSETFPDYKEIRKKIKT